MAQGKKRVLITGATGMLGRHVVEQMQMNGENEVYTISRSVAPYVLHTSLDITDRKSTQQYLQKVNPDMIIHCAAKVDVNRCETEREDTYALHVDSTGSLSTFPSVKKFIYVSTDSVFDGQRGNYSEADETHPLNYYSETKLRGEEVVLKSSVNKIILRTNIVGYNTPLKNSLFEWGYKNLAAGTRIKGFENVFFNALYCGNVADIISRISVLTVPDGVYHIGGREPVSKFQFLKKIAHFFSFPEDLISPSRLDINPPAAIRPLNTVLLTDKIESVTGIKMPSSDDSFQYLFNSFSNYLNI